MSGNAVPRRHGAAAAWTARSLICLLLLSLGSIAFSFQSLVTSGLDSHDIQRPRDDVRLVAARTKTLRAAQARESGTTNSTVSTAPPGSDVNKSTVALSPPIVSTESVEEPPDGSSPTFSSPVISTESVTEAPDGSSPPTASPPPAIPLIIHQSWKTPERIPTRFAPWMQSWVAFHPDWQYVFWTDNDNLAIFERHYPRYAYVARAVSKIALADMARYALLHHVGGLYVDADFECLQPFDQLHHAHTLFLSYEPLVHTVLLERSTTPSLCNAIMASAPGHAFWLRSLESIKEKFDQERLRSDAVSLTGPRLIKRTYEQYFTNDGSVTVLPSEYFYPEVAYWNIGSMKKACQSRSDAATQQACDWLDRFPRGEFTSYTHATHHWQCTWCLKQSAHEFMSLDGIFNSSSQVFRPQFDPDHTGSLRLVPYTS